MSQSLVDMGHSGRVGSVQRAVDKEGQGRVCSLVDMGHSEKFGSVQWAVGREGQGRVFPLVDMGHSGRSFGFVQRAAGKEGYGRVFSPAPVVVTLVISREGRPYHRSIYP